MAAMTMTKRTTKTKLTGATTRNFTSASKELVRQPHDPRWQSVLSRDRAADGTFVYAVKTTGVYCRPTCAARLPRPDNVTFFMDGEAARHAGYRACKRCAPDGDAQHARHARQVERLCRLITQRIMDTGAAPSHAELAAHVKLSVFHMHRLFKRTTGVTPRVFATAERARRMRSELSAAPGVTRAIYDAGYGSSSRFYAGADATLGMTARAFQARGRAQAVRFGVGQCSLGSVLVAASARGVCAVSLGDDPERLVHALEERFARAELVPGDREFERWMAQVIGFIEAPKLGWQLPLDLQGTLFQQRVWSALTKIPVGQTRTYAQLAEAIGQPRAIRAVGSACAANLVAVAIPCHRVVRSDGSLSGYRWGVARKRELLDREARGS